MIKKVVRERERASITGVPRSTCYEMMKEGRFPKPIKVGKKAVGWLVDELYQFVDDRIAERDQAQG